VDFCQSHNWEIVGNELYFAQESGTGHKDDPTSMFQDISTFIDEVRPALGKPLDEKQLKNLTPYGKDRRTDLKCPVCNKEMINNGQFFKCPGHHGALVNGSTLIKINDGELKLKQSEKEQPAKRPKIIHCPSCDNKMDQVAYQGGPIQIDSCTNCHYRWLDHGELVNS